MHSPMIFRPLLTLCALLFIAAVNASCVSMSESECRSGDWRAYGAADAAQGSVSEKQPARIKACQDHGVKPDLASYAVGMKEGQKAYCTPKGGWQIGYHGGSYDNSCPKETAAATVHAMSLAKEIYIAQSEVDQAQRQHEDHMFVGILSDQHLLQERADRIYARNVAEYVRLFGSYPDQ